MKSRFRPRASFDSIAFMKNISLSSEKQEAKPMKVNQYIFLKKIANGSTSKVFVAKNTNNNDLCAVKVINSNQDNLAQLAQEVRMMQHIKHQNVIRMRDLLYSSERMKAFLVLEYSDIGSLSSVLDNGIKLTEKEIASIIKQVALGLSFIHSKKVAHQDIKPRNILLFSDGKAKITDFGIGKSLQNLDTMFAGSPAYQAPEMFDAFDDLDEEETIVDPIKCDIYSLGVTSYECCTNRLPFKGGSIFEIAHEMRNNSNIIFPKSCTISEDLKLLIKGLMNFDPKKRISLNDFLNSDYMRDIDETKNVFSSFKPADIPDLPSDSQYDEITAEVCGSNGLFSSCSPLLFSLYGNNGSEVNVNI